MMEASLEGGLQVMSRRWSVIAMAVVSLWGLGSCSDAKQVTMDVVHPAPDVPHLPDVAQPVDHALDAVDLPQDVATEPPPALDAGAACSADGGARCGEGLSCCRVCCTEPAVFQCLAPDPDGNCPAPDLFIDQDALNQELQVYDASFDADSCEMQEGCVNAPGVRRILGFTTLTPNMGTQNLDLGDAYAAGGSANFVWSPCHMHYHFMHYAEYRLLDQNGNKILVGRKQAFCLEDFETYSQDAPQLTNDEIYTCQPGSSQGIHVGWADRYYAGLPCQWLDITDLPSGSYTLEMEVNPDRVLVEKNYDNNITRAPVTVTDRGTPNPLNPCGAPIAEQQRECGWKIEGSFTCTPGQTVAVGCNQAAACNLGSCEGDPLMRVCDGMNNACFYGDALATNDDAPNCNGQGTGEPPDSCPYAGFTCPQSGNYTVLSAAYSDGDSYTCTVAAR
jgi:hypothetical protein